MALQVPELTKDKVGPKERSLLFSLEKEGELYKVLTLIKEHEKILLFLNANLKFFKDQGPNTPK